MELFSSVTFAEKLLFTKHLSVMTRSGITISDGLRYLLEQTKNKAFYKVLASVTKDIKNGSSLAQAFKKFPAIFDPFYISLVDIGERSGTLDENFAFLSIQLAKERDLRSKVKSALLYPAIVLSLATIMGGGITIFVLPKLVTLFDSFTVELPATTKVLMFVGKNAQEYGFFVIGAFIGFIFVLQTFVQVPFIKPWWHRLLLKLPVMGKFIKHAQLVAFFRNLGIMLKSGLPIITALEIEYNIMSNLVFKNYVTRVKTGVQEGKRISIILTSGGFEYIPDIAQKMVLVGEQTGKLDEILLYLSDYFEEELDAIARNFSVSLEPIMMIVIGIVTLFLALAIIAPIYSLTGGVH